jgi:hypothetical protein
VIGKKYGCVQWRIDLGTDVSVTHAIPVAIYEHPEADTRGSILETHRNVRRPEDGLGASRRHARSEMTCGGASPNPVDRRKRLRHRDGRQHGDERYDEKDIHVGVTVVGNQRP